MQGLPMTKPNFCLFIITIVQIFQDFSSSGKLGDEFGLFKFTHCRLTVCSNNTWHIIGIIVVQRCNRKRKTHRTLSVFC